MNAPESKPREEIIPTRQTLLERLKNLDDSQSWREFFDTYWRLIYSVAIKFGLSEEEAREVVQDTVISVSRHIQGFVYDPSRGSFKNWMLQMTHWRVLDQLKRRKAHRENFVRSPAESGSEARTATIDRIPDPKSGKFQEVWEEEWRNNLFEAAVEQIKSKVNARHFQIFDFYVFKKQSTAKVCRMFGVSISQVYLIKHRISGMIKKQMKKMEERPG